MAIKDLLVHLDLAPASEGRREAALALAEAFGAHVTALCLIAEPILRSMPSRHLPADVVREYIAQAERDLDTVLAAATERAGERGVHLTTRREIGSLDRLPHLLGLQGRHADLVIVGQPNPELGGADDALLAEAAFMDTGRPALVVPYAAGVPPLPPRRALLAWDGSREAARAAHDAIPLLRLTEAVTVLIVDARDLSGRLGQQPGSDIASHLVCHGIEAAVKRVESHGQGIGAVILAQAEEERAELVVAGGYGHSRLREMFLGGATSYLLEHMTTPILFSH
jgi:nucleotide-binding universal stress UspA family protein